MHHLHLAAECRGVSPGDSSRCAVCGPSPFGAARPASDVFGPNFTDYELIADPSAPQVCAGCVSLLSGRPGDDPPPLRTMHALLVEGAAPVYPGTRAIAGILRSPPERPFVLTWTATRQRHAILRAGLSSAAEVLVGTERGTAAYRPAEHEQVLDAVEAMRAVFTPDEIVSGDYPPTKLAGALELYQRCEPSIAPHRGAILLEMIAAVAIKPEQAHQEAHVQALDADDDAAWLLADLAEASDLRRADGLGFWRATLQRRLEAVKHRPLLELVSKLAERLQCQATSPAMMRVHQRLVVLSDAEAEQLRRAFAHHATIVVALAFSHHRQRREERAE